MTRITSNRILDVFNDRISDYIDNGIHIKVERTKGSYKVVAYDNGKSVGRIYIQDIREKSDGGYIAHLRRLHVTNTHRNLGLGRKLLETAINTFRDIDLYGHASPNRNKDMFRDNSEEYRERLKSFYNSVGLKSVGIGHRVERVLN